MKKPGRVHCAFVAVALWFFGGAVGMADAQQILSVPGAEQPIGVPQPQQLFPARSSTGQPIAVWDDKILALAGGENLTAISGRAVDLVGRGIVGVEIRVGQISTVTDSDGRYLLAGVKPGDSVMQIDARRAGPEDATDYGTYEIKVAATEGITNFLPYKSWLPRIDHDNEITIDSPTKTEVVLTNPSLPGIEIHIPAGTVITGPDHKPVTKIGLTPIPSDKTPFPLPHNVTVPQYFTIQPGGATLSGVDGQWVGIQVWYPNYNNMLPGAKTTFWRYDAYGPGWLTYGTGTVSEDMKHVVPDPGTRLYDFTSAMFGGAVPPDYGSKPPANPNDPGNCPNCTCGDPIDPSTGLWTEQFVDLTVTDVTPLTVVRTFRQNDPNPRSFGYAMTLNYDMYLYSAHPYTEADLILPDGGRVHFNRTSPGIDWPDAALQSKENPGPFYHATIVWNGSGWDLRTQDGTLYVFADNAPLRYIEDRLGNRITLTRDTPSGPINFISSSNGRWIKFNRNTRNFITSATDNSGRTVTYGYDDPGVNFLTTVTDPDGGITTFNWDTANKRITSIQYPRQNPSGPVSVTTTYDANGRAQTQTLLGNVTYTFAYTLNGSNVTATDITMTDATYTPTPRTKLCKLTFNSSGYWSTNKQAFGTPIEQASTAVRGGEAIPAACTLNTPANSPPNALIALTDGLNRTTCWTYNTGGQMLTETRLAGTPNAVTTTYTYGAYNQLASVKDPLNHTTTIGLDSLGRATSITDALSHTSTISPNPNGQIGSITDPLSHTTSFTYDRGDLVAVTDALNRVSKLYTDPLGRTIQATDPRANLSLWTYDKIWGVKIATDANTNAVTTNYDIGGLVSSVVDPRSAMFKTEYTYDTKGRLTTREDPLDHDDTINTYDGYSNPRTTTDRKGQNATFGYDLLGRIVSATLADGHTLAYTWDKGNRLTEVSDTVSGVTNKVTRVYDGLDRLTSETVMQGAVTLGTVGYTYDAASRLATKSVPGQSLQCYVFDNADRLTSIKIGTTCAAASAWTSFTYDNADRRATITLHNGVVGTYVYSNADEVLSITYKKSTTTLGALTYTYDTAGRIASRGGSLFKSVLPAATTATAAYNADNQLTSWNGTAISTDLNGNLTNDGTRSFTWDARNRLTGITGVASYVYDGVGRRQSATQGATTTAVVYDGYDAVQEQSPVGTVTANIHTGLGTDERFDRYAGGVGAFYLTDLLGSTVGLSDINGTAVQTTYGYDPYGVTTQAGTANSNRYQFTGRENDGTGLYYYRARYYNPTWGRFINEDPIGLAGGINLYAYVGGNPLTYVDPDGQLFFLVPMIIGAGIGAASDIGIQLLLNGGNVNCINWGQVGISAGLGAIGGGLGSVTRFARAGSEFSHWIPSRYIRPLTLLGKNPNPSYIRALDVPGVRNFINGSLNGNYVSGTTHALTDPFRYTKGMTNADKFTPVIQQLLRVPGWLGGSAGGSAIGATNSAVNN